MADKKNFLFTGSLGIIGGREGIRTPDPLGVNQVL